MLETVEKYLPIGSIVTIKDIEKKLMIIGYCLTIQADKEKKNDYIACLHPEGIVNLRETYAIKHEQIDKVHYMGYVDKNTEMVNEVLKIATKERESNE